jgi:hypothetical protein
MAVKAEKQKLRHQTRSVSITLLPNGPKPLSMTFLEKPTEYGIGR